MKDRYHEWRTVPLLNNMEDFNPTEFICFTHSLGNKISLNIYKKMIEKTQYYSEEQEKIDLSVMPIATKRKERITCTLTSASNNYTYGRVGLIISAPIENILFYWSSSI